MHDSNWQKLRKIFDDALARDPEKRDEFLDEACAGDDDLRREVDSLLSAMGKAGSFLESPPFEAVTAEIPVLKSGQMLNHYEITRCVGEGGMGQVYLATDTKLDRPVAIKVLTDKYKHGEDSIRRFTREAKTASALNHPNILTIFEIGEFEQTHFIVSEFVTGETLRTTLKRERLDLAKIVGIASQAASALAAAHKARIIHRDIKPENIMLREDGYVKVLDFGLAKLLPEPASLVGDKDRTERQNTTAAGVIMGTVNYMSPEQATGTKVDERTDIFSLGVTVYEMITGKAPFAGNSMPETFANLLNKEPEPLDKFVAGVPDELQQIVRKMLERDPADRYPNADELLADLHQLDAGRVVPYRLRRSEVSDARDARTHILNGNETGIGAIATGETTARSWAANGRLKIAAAVAAVLAIALAGGAWLRHRSNVNWAMSQVAQVQEFARAGKTFEAFDLASKVQEYLPGDQTLAEVMPSISDTLTVNSEPAGAKIYLKRYQPDENGAFPERQLIGTTPITKLRIPKGPQIVYFEKDGYAPVQTVISNRLIKFGDNMLWNPSSSVEVSRNLMEAAAVPDKMVFVPGGEYRLASSMRPTDDKVRLDDYFIDKYEVSNKDYKEFVSAGGYAKQEYWKVPVVKDGRTLSWDEAMALFHDRTSLPSPREWSNQNFPDGKGDHPVTGITWYEAAAYAEFRGKKLPTVFQWEKAARNGAHQDASYKMPWGDQFPGDSFKDRANFDGTGTVPVEGEEFGISEFGAFNMAGNVSEWVSNQGADGYFATGGAWGEPPYTFSSFGEYPGLFESSKRGFRCVRLVAADRASGDQGGEPLQKDRIVQDYPRTTDAQFRELARKYDYAKTPLDAEVVEAVGTADWRREKITFNGAGGKRAIAYLYLPHNAAPPLQVVEMMAGSDVEAGITPVPVSAEGWLGSVVRSGRALLAVVVEGNTERPWPPNFVRPGYETVEWQDININRYNDYRRGLDYLQTRGDIDMTRVGYVGLSLGASQGVILPAIEPRIRSVFLASAGLHSYFMVDQPAANPVNFAPHVLQPKHVLNGRFDENFPIKSALEPLMKLLPEPKELELYDGPHATPIEVLAPAMNKFFDKTLGPVRRQ